MTPSYSKRQHTYYQRDASAAVLSCRFGRATPRRQLQNRVRPSMRPHLRPGRQCRSQQLQPRKNNTSPSHIKHLTTPSISPSFSLFTISSSLPLPISSIAKTFSSLLANTTPIRTITLMTLAPRSLLESLKWISRTVGALGLSFRRRSWPVRNKGRS